VVVRGGDGQLVEKDRVGLMPPCAHSGAPCCAGPWMTSRPRSQRQRRRSAKPSGRLAWSCSDPAASTTSSSFIVICAGGGGVPVVEYAYGRYRGVEAVIDKDLASLLLAVDLHTDALGLATDLTPSITVTAPRRSERPLMRHPRRCEDVTCRPGRCVRKSRRPAASSKARAGGL
jgi:hypothetical protein